MGPQVMTFMMSQGQLVPMKSLSYPISLGPSSCPLGISSQQWETPGISKGWGSCYGRWGHRAPEVPTGPGDLQLFGLWFFGLV